MKTNGSQVNFVPFLKWAGGKRWLVDYYSHLFPQSFNVYIEPFLGAASVYFYMKPKKAILGDLNADLVTTYEVIKTNWKSLENSLAYRHKKHNLDMSYYYWLRDKEPTNLIQRASRFIYLNRTCFNGIYRVNKLGKFNVPRGSKNKVVLDSDDFEGISKLLKGAELISCDFEILVSRAERGDFVFADPPYTVLHNNNGFRKYNDVLFSWKDQERLAVSLLSAARRGVKIFCTNANHYSVRDLYDKSEFSVQVVKRCSRISASSSSRKYVEELVITSNI
jgi:DNA adenine methylase